MQTSLYTVAQVRAIDAYAINTLGIPGIELMRRAASVALKELRRRWPDARRINVLCGPGNNGGDGFLLAKLAREVGMKARVLALSERSSGDAAEARQIYAHGGGKMHVAEDAPFFEPADVCVDALFGSGLARPPTGTAAQLIEAINADKVPVLALDVPSGLDADHGVCAGVAVRAAATMCFVAWKRGLFTHQGLDCCGDLVLDGLALPTDLQPPTADAELLDAPTLGRRKATSHKGDYGHVLVVGGDHGFGGAVRLAAEAALRVGAGTVSVATRPEHVSALLAPRPELMVHGVDSGPDLAALLARAGVLAVGPGLGQQTWGQSLWDLAMAAPQPLLLDADGLNFLASKPRDFKTRPTVLTPHPGEAARLLGTDVASIQGDRFAAVRELAQRYAAVVVLKGAGSLIASPAARVAVCRHGNPGMASGGMGDLLTGVIAGLLAQSMSPWAAACFGVDLHARAGDQAAQAGERGLLASDLFVPLRSMSNDGA